MATNTTQDVALLSIGEQSKLIASKQLSPVELTQTYLDRINGDLGKKIDAFLLLTPERAMADAKKAEAEIAQGKNRGPLHVIPLSWSQDYPAPLTINVEDNALLLQAIAGYDPADQHSANVPVPNYSEHLKDGVKGLRVGVLREQYLSSGNADGIAATEKAIE